MIGWLKKTFGEQPPKPKAPIEVEVSGQIDVERPMLELIPRSNTDYGHVRRHETLSAALATPPSYPNSVLVYARNVGKGEVEIEWMAKDSGWIKV